MSDLDEAKRAFQDKGGTVTTCPPRWADGAAEQQYVRTRKKGQKE